MIELIQSHDDQLNPTAIGCWLYNLIAGWSGGVSLTLEPDGTSDSTA